MVNSFIKNTKKALKELENTNKIRGYLSVLNEMKNEEIYLDFSMFEKVFNKNLRAKGVKSASFKRLIDASLLENIIIKDENAKIQKKADGTVVADPEISDTESIPLISPGGIEEFIKEEVLPYYEDAFVDKSKTQIGYEINFTKYFYEPKQLESVESIVASIRELEQQSEGLMKEILEGLYE